MSNQIEQAMLNHVDQWQKGGLSKKEYAMQLGITRHKFDYWIRKSKEKQDIKAEGLGFIEIEKKQDAPTANNPSPRIVLTLPGGMNLQIF